MKRIFNAIMRKFTAIKTEIREDFTPNRQLTEEQCDRKRVRSIKKITAGIMAASMATSLMGIPCFALGEDGGGSTEGVETFNTVVEFIVDWVARIGLVVGFIGAVQFALGFKDDSESFFIHSFRCSITSGAFTL